MAAVTAAVSAVAAVAAAWAVAAVAVVVLVLAAVAVASAATSAAVAAVRGGGENGAWRPPASPRPSSPQLCPPEGGCVYGLYVDEPAGGARADR